jgi:hypothetical protein
LCCTVYAVNRHEQTNCFIYVTNIINIIMQVNVKYVIFVSFETSSFCFCFKREYMTDIGTKIRPNMFLPYILYIRRLCIQQTRWIQHYTLIIGTCRADGLYYLWEANWFVPISWDLIVNNEWTIMPKLRHSYNQLLQMAKSLLPVWHTTCGSITGIPVQLHVETIVYAYVSE